MDLSFDDIRRSLIEKLQALYGWTKKVLYFSTYLRLIDLMSFGFDKLAYYGEFLFRESTLKNAKLRKSVIDNVYLLGYKPHRKISATGEIKLSIDENFDNEEPLIYTGESIIIPKWTPFSDEKSQYQVFTTEQAIYHKNTTVIHRNIPATDIAVSGTEGIVLIPVTLIGIETAHPFTQGMEIRIKDTINYDGDYIVQEQTTATHLAILATYESEVFIGTEMLSTGDLYIPAKEGLWKEFKYLAKGLKDEIIPIFSNSVENDEIYIWMIDPGTEEIITNVAITDEPYFVNDVNNYYVEILDDSDGRAIRLRFGDGVHTRKLESGEKVLIKYVESKGINGNIRETNVIVQANIDIYTAGGEPAPLFITNDDEISDGDDIESIESIRNKARNLFQEGYLAHTQNGYRIIIESHLKVHKSIVWTKYDLDELTVSVDQNIVYATAVSTDGSPLTAQQETDIMLTHLRHFKGITDVVQWRNLERINMMLLISAKVNPVPHNQLKNEIFEELEILYGILYREFSQNVYDSDLQSRIQNLENIIYHKTDIYHVEKSEIFVVIDSETTKEIAVSQRDPILSAAEKIYVQEGTVELWWRKKVDGEWLENEQLAKTNPSLDTELIQTGIIELENSAISYGDNTISWKLKNTLIEAGPPPIEGNWDLAYYGDINPKDSDLVGYQLRLVYKTKTAESPAKFLNDIRLAYFYQITDLNPEDITYTFEY